VCGLQLGLLFILFMVIKIAGLETIKNKMLTIY
jgi:hypothetical protein